MEGYSGKLRKYIPAYFLGLVSSVILITSLPSFASDRLGCLTCHRYPGLVRLEKTGKFKVLHIDEVKHLKSPHREVDCQQCHTPIIKMPHTGDTGVECTTSCHLEDKEKIDAMKPSLINFHKDERFSIIRLDDKSACRVCHPLYPHSNNHKVRALLNMHNGYLVCEVCHIKKENFTALTYGWKEPEHVEFTGEPYGMLGKNEKEMPRKPESVISRMLKIFSSPDSTDKAAIKTTYSISRIAAYAVKNNKKRLLMNRRDNREAEKYKSTEKSLSPGEKENKLAFFHREIARKEVSVACNECHSENGILDFKALGFDEKRTMDLVYMNIKSLVTKYDEFYFPKLFRR
jgi:hypothetical protein